MGITINGSSAAGNIDLGTNGTITDLAVGGLPDGVIDTDSLAASAVTSAKIADATIATGDIADNAVTDAKSTITAYNDLNVRHDISMLALHFANNENKSYFNLANSTIDYMEDNNSIASNTNASYDATNEWWYAGSVVDVAYGITAITQHDLSTSSGWPGALTGSGGNAFHTDNSGVAAYFRIDLGSAKAVNKIRLHTTAPASCNWRIDGSSDDSSWTDTGWDMNVSGVDGYTIVEGATHTYRYFRFYKTTGDAGGGYHTNLNMYTGSVNATASAISQVFNASSARTEVSGVLLYRNMEGTATLGTDLKVYFSCNNGSNWTEASSYTVMDMAFKSGPIISVTLGKTTCTSGTQIKYKLEWANQSDGSKETGVQGVALQY